MIVAFTFSPDFSRFEQKLIIIKGGFILNGFVLKKELVWEI